VRQFAKPKNEFMKKICLIILLFVLRIHSQEILTKDELYKKDNLVYKTSNSELFTGKAQRFKHKTHLTFEIEFEKGILKKGALYYNGKEKIVSEERYYFDNDRQIEKKIRYSLDHKTVWIKYYNKLGQKILEENYKDGKLVYSCPYSENKKNGIIFCINDKGEKNECKYENGKLLKE
jgi:antitoxin component YwqK of YwqJK toxin-antitoxin module